MTNENQFTLYSQRIESAEGPDIVEISLTFKPDGSLRIEGVYAGPKAEAFWGDWDHEFWMNIATPHAQAFLALLAQEAFNSEEKLTYSKLKELCESTGIPIEQGHWT
ncbi:hypothetical protein ACFQ3C_05030 [Seohaeicola saemankumensis]|uniref:Uncharacterized protein n=1 Tax=Seohaeicola saemankumensis TaxID=481181 RepID=A0ABW3T9Z6_9RHOB